MDVSISSVRDCRLHRAHDLEMSLQPGTLSGRSRSDSSGHPPIPDDPGWQVANSLPDDAGSPASHRQVPADFLPVPEPDASVSLLLDHLQTHFQGCQGLAGLIMQLPGNILALILLDLDQMPGELL